MIKTVLFVASRIILVLYIYIYVIYIYIYIYVIYIYIPVSVRVKVTKINTNARRTQNLDEIFIFFYASLQIVKFKRLLFTLYDILLRYFLGKIS